ncbi:EF-hand domain-containing protein [Sphingomonas immobilis]|uniref:EF-hand domain-containing protein n=1 Tax=Sphingomonas immobilis TaxID=3063997 RepID=A0ABT9A0N8_9SPHN|nr:EF-hand domain-containing protein [Sphingomonas sp. CA1-15]MDO7843017.1 EF-hand domain-containing protein [Sphingomonas sp. CA1-15]
MWRYLVGGLAAMLLTAGGFLYFGGRGSPGAALPLAGAQAGAAQTADALPDAAPEASERTREQKRFDRYDKDRDGKVTRDEYLLARHKAYAKLDLNHDGKLDFDEWAAKTEAKFATADADKSGAMTASEFATTKPKRKAKVRARCPENQQAAPAAKDEEES